MIPRLGILCGGRSGEHEVSLRSAAGIYHAVDRSRFQPLLVGITKEGSWQAGSAEDLLLEAHDPAKIRLRPEWPSVLPSGAQGRLELRPQTGTEKALVLDVVLPIIHGTDGEDGALQGLLRMFGVPFVGADVLGSSIGMDKDVMKRLMAYADLPVARFAAFTSAEDAHAAFPRLSQELGLPLFVKPSALGSSVGVSKARTEAEFREAVRAALTFDEKVMVEASVPGRELEVSVLGNRHSRRWPPRASRVGEIIPRHEFYSYAAKYLDDNGAELKIPASLAEGVERRVQELALRAFHTLECDGMARVDFFFLPDGRLMLNEINTLPGFTPISMYPKLWEASGVSYSALVTQLVELALERHERRTRLLRDFHPA